MLEINDEPTLVSCSPADSISKTGPQRACLLGLSLPLCGELIPLRRQQLVIGRAEDADLRLLGQGVSRRHARLLLRSGAYFLEDLGSTNGTRVNRRRIRRVQLHDGDQLQLGETLLGFLHADALAERFHRRLYAAALRDGLTRLFNKRYFTERLSAEVAYAARHLRPLSLLLIDVDLFKRVNDEHGHPMGDRALRKIAGALARATRAEDVLSRCGGEEFAVLCRGLAMPAAHLVAERVRSAVAALVLPLGGRAPLRLTVSVGVAELPRGQPASADPARFVALADQALYEAKAAGRNCVRLAAGAPS